MHLNENPTIHSLLKQSSRLATSGVFRVSLLSGLFTVLPLISAHARKPPAAMNADSIHWAAWDSVISIADSEPAVRYAFYAYRTLAVPCPEIYLRSDSLFTEIVKEIPGSQAAFIDRDPRNLELYRRLTKGEQKGLSFAWEQRSLDPGSVSDSGSGSLYNSWLDYRLPSAAILLRSFSPHLSTLEAASLLYTQLRSLGQSDRALFVIVDSAGRGYLVEDGRLVSLQTGGTLDSNLASISPVLVFNERAVFYPLFGRDDRGINPPLGDLVGRLRPPASPKLSILDRIRLEKLRHAAALPNQRVRDLAMIAASGAVGAFSPALQRAWGSVTSDTVVDSSSRERAMVRTTVYWADMLSRPVASLAAIGNAPGFEENASRWQKNYLQVCGRLATIKGEAPNPDRFEAWGNLWAEKLLEITFDDVIRTRAGTGSSQSLAMSAALDMVRHPYFRLEIDPGNRLMADQTWIISEDGHWQFNLGIWTPIVDTFKIKSPPPLMVYSYSKAGDWICIETDGLESDVDNLTVASNITDAARQLRTATLIFPAPRNLSRTLNEVMMKLESGELPIRPLLWPAVDAISGHP